MMTVRVLPRDEWGKLTEVINIGPACREGDAQVLVVEDGKRIVATLGVFRIAHFEGLWIDPEYRGNPGLARKLMKAGVTAAKQWTDEFVWGASGSHHTDDLFERAGGVNAPISTYIIPLGGA